MPELTPFVDSKQGFNRPPDGSSFTYRLEPALMVPFGAEPALRVLEANVFYTSPNVSAAKSNSKLKFSVITSGTVAGGDVSTTDHEVTFDRRRVGTSCMSRCFLSSIYVNNQRNDADLSPAGTQYTW